MELPNPKRIRLTMDHSAENLRSLKTRAILADEYTNDIPLQRVYVSTIIDRKLLSSTILELSQKLPIENLQHLKRVRRNHILILPVQDVELQTSGDEDSKLVLKGLLKARGLSDTLIQSLSANLSELDVPMHLPKLRWQYDAVNQLWPCKFHPNKHLEALYENTNFSDQEKSFQQTIVEIITRLNKTEQRNFGLCIDPRMNSIVALACDRTASHPIHHCPMVLIDFVARTQNGGIWSYDDEKFLTEDNELSTQGITEKHRRKIVDDWGYNVTFGAEKIHNEHGRSTSSTCSNHLEDSNLTKYGPYLCTGYDVYLFKEPCLMCAMALVHSRVRRIFFMKHSQNGALESKLKLHTIKDLNHRFEVFQCSSIDNKTKN